MTARSRVGVPVSRAVKRGLRALTYVGRHPLQMVKLAAAFDDRDGFATARNLPGSVSVDAAFALMAEHDVADVTFLRDGTRWRTDLGDDIGLSLWRSGGYQGTDIAAACRWLRAAGRSNGTIFDVGANVGTTSVPFARAGYDVVAIEPVPRTFEMLCANVDANQLGGSITPVRSAVGRTTEPVRMWTGFASGQAEVAVDDSDPTITRFGGSKGELVEVACAPLGNLVAAASVPHSSIALVWCDVQGSELQVIETATEVWAAGVPLYLEIDPLALELHGGLERFVAVVGQHFASFVGRDGLRVGAPLQPIDRFGELIASLPSSSYTDALLVP